MNHSASTIMLSARLDCDYRPASAKASLDFIMNKVDSDVAAAQTMRAPDVVVTPTNFIDLAAEAANALPLPLSPSWRSASSGSPPRVSRGRNGRSDDKRRGRECKVDGCDNYIINRGLCFRHGVRLNGI